MLKLSVFCVISLAMVVKGALTIITFGQSFFRQKEVVFRKLT